MNKSYFKITVSLIALHLALLTLLFLLVTILYLYHNHVGNLGKGSIFAILIPIIVLIILSPCKWCYPTIDNTSLRIRWIYYPFLNKKFDLKDLDHILFLRKTLYGAHFTMKVFLKSGRVYNYYDMECMKFSDLGDFINKLEESGVVIENQLHINDV